MKTAVVKSKRYHKSTYFKDLHEGEHFLQGDQEYVKTVPVSHGVSISHPSGLSITNNIRICDGQISGMGDQVKVQRYEI